MPAPDERLAGDLAPEITEQMRLSAKQNPNSWLYVLDPAFEHGHEAPPWGVVGAYPVDADGEIEPDFRPNAEYLPSPQALHLPLPTNELERLLQLVYAKHEPHSALAPAVLTATLHVYSDSEEADDVASPAEPARISGFRTKEGELLVPACTAEGQVPVKWPGWQTLTGQELVPLLGEQALVLNPDTLLSAVIPAAELRAALDA
ncbi:type III secretion system (T3SS) SseB-like protein [Tamaricihabitans halophyticus]|uniref:Type III secretion system (T3SS) SseB-like protein n=1 Tax=Tamaricihabitans halophyticus TaxID=1262583 RepID=A0A4R2QW40_9PSEU|nr:type VII secretion system-associated protein [Tamaricihabitans halophyticus]TCP54320.1 type III secretion system (T3SS) SseB-like protein [Tamaricihabitans halophyticus]